MSREKKKVQLSLFARFETYGDYSIRDPSEEFNEMYPGFISADTAIMYHAADHVCGQPYFFSLMCAGDWDDCRGVILRFLEVLSVSFDVASTHNWLVKDLFELCEQVYEAVSTREVLPDYYYAELDGNYKGTEIIVYVNEVK